ncbi:SCO family protein [Dokdonia ponticola]|uniref:SCO family protein n=1 Tax=Dokdonia ponticola TaxID=2041041 RepID=A0ABV9HZR7_9FLAO
MIRFFERYKVFAVVMLILSTIIITVIYSLLKVPEKLPIYQPDMVDNQLVDSTIQYVKKYHKIAPFTLINQNGDTITQEDYKDKIYVADFFFTTCQTICPIMTDHMVQIQNELQEDQEVLLLSHSVIPEYDTPAILKEYAQKKGVDDARWNLVTGLKKDIYTLARKSYLAVKDVPGEEDAMVHTENFMLVDKKSQIRGYYDGTDPEAIEELLEDIAILKMEYQPKRGWLEKLLN